MGFGSYDESEQEKQELDTDDEESEAVAVHKNDHDGELRFESEASTADLVSKLDDMKEQSQTD